MTPYVKLVLCLLLGLSEAGRVSSENMIPGSMSITKRVLHMTRRTARDFACTPVPEISVVSYTRDGFRPDDTFQTELIPFSAGGNPAELSTGSSSAGQGTVIFSPFEATVEILCEASVPVQWTFDGPNAPGLSSIVISREDDEPVSEGPEPCFRITIKLITTKQATGKYVCSTFGNRTQNSVDASLYLYGNGNGPPLLLNHGKEFSVTPNAFQKVILPCQVVNPTLRPQLFKGESSVVAIQNSVEGYDPQIGFTLDLQKIPDPYDKYKCKQGEYFIYVNVKPGPEYRVTPSSSRVTIVQNATLTLECEGRVPIGLQGFIDDSKVTVIINEAAEYKYGVIYDLGGTEDSTVTCIELKTKAILHSWKATIISEEAERRSGIYYDDVSERFYCRSKTKEAPAIALALCNSPIECQLADKCFTWNAPYIPTNGRPDCSSSIIRGTTCRNSEKDGHSECAYIENKLYAGVVHCSLPANGGSSKMYFFNGLSRKAVISDWRQFSPNESVRLKLLPPSRTFYAGEEIEFRCTAQKFLFATGLRFMVQTADGSYVVPIETETEESANNNLVAEEPGLIVKASTLRLNDTRIRKVLCFAPFWNTTEWLNTSMEIIVNESTEPRILSPEPGTILPFLTGSNQSLTCEAEGTPAPHVAWYRNGKKVGHQREGSLENGTGNLRNSVIYFGHVDEDDTGEYVCNATNVRGSQVRSFKLTIAPENRRTFYTVIVLGILIFTSFLIAVTVLCKKLRKNQKLVRKLTEKEFHEFHKGDMTALMSLPDGYIRAQYLPYNKEYEILQENLEIDQEKVLGEGEYGIVLKGTLRQNDSLKDVAVKTIRGSDANGFKALLSELKILTYIGWHDNVINLLGAVTRNIRDRDVYVVVEYCRLGDLESYLRNNRNSFLNQIVGDRIDLSLTFNFNSTQTYQSMDFNLRTGDLISWAYQIASGMEYLSNKKVIHGDLAPRNILLTEDRTIKITDFGLSKHLYNDSSNYISHATMNLPWRLCAPEILQYNSIFSTHSDVWAFGVTLWEVFSLGVTPYDGLPFSWDFRARLLQGYRMDRPSFSNQNIYNNILKCWKNVPAERISFEELRKYFHWLLHHWEEEESIPAQSTNLQFQYLDATELNRVNV